MSHRHAICLVIDGLRAAALGAYGNTTSPTPNLDSFASRALVVDWLWADSPFMSDFYRSVWQGVHAIRPNLPADHRSNLEQIRCSGVRQRLVTDDAALASMASTLPFDETRLLTNDVERAATRLEETALGRFFSQAVERLYAWHVEEDHEDESSITWLHCRGLVGPWDAPRELRAELLDEADPPPPEFVDPPVALRAVEDPDVLLSYRVAYTAQIAVLDACVGAFTRAVEDAFADDETLISFVGSTGFALGEHGAIGTDCTELYSERLHLPWILYPCGNTTPLPRLAALAQPADVGATLLEWLTGSTTTATSDGISYLPHLCESGLAAPRRENLRQMVAAIGGKQEQAIRTAAWMLRQCAGGSPKYELFTKPDDRWEGNDVEDLCPEIVRQLQEELAGWTQSRREGGPLPRTPQHDDLMTPSR